MWRAPDQRPAAPGHDPGGIRTPRFPIPLMMSLALHGAVAASLAAVPTIIPPRPMTVGPPAITVMLVDETPAGDASGVLASPSRDAHAGDVAGGASEVPSAVPEAEAEAEAEAADEEEEKETETVPDPGPDPDATVPRPEVKPLPPERPARPSPAHRTRPLDVGPGRAVMAHTDASGEPTRRPGRPAPEAGATGGDNAASGSAGTPDQAPRYTLGSRHAPAPPYPEQARRRGHEGAVVLAARVAADGTVTDIRVIRSSGHGALDRAARHAVRGWRFHPATRAGIPVPGEARVTIRFSLR